MRRFLITLVVLALLRARPAGLVTNAFWQFRPRLRTPPLTKRFPSNGAPSTVQSAPPAASIQRPRFLSRFVAPGRVDQVLVTVGQAVEAGQLLAQLDVTNASLALEQSDVALQISRAQLAKMENPPSDNDIAAAQASVTVAQASVASGEASLAGAGILPSAFGRCHCRGTGRAGVADSPGRGQRAPGPTSL